MILLYADLSEQSYEINVIISYVLKIHQMQQYWL